MNLLSQLVAANTPPPMSYDERKRIRDKQRRKNSAEVLAAKRANIHIAHEGQTKKAVERYRTAMTGKGWMTTNQIEIALGYTRTIATPFLKKLLEELKLVERRAKGGGKYNRRAGWEWRWITQEKK